MVLSAKNIGRLILYRRLLADPAFAGRDYIYSHDLATAAGVGAAQVRRDLMQAGFGGSPARGYRVRDLCERLACILDPRGGQGAVLVGIGNLGRAILTYFHGRHPALSIVAAFDSDPAKVNRVAMGVRCHPMDDLPDVVSRQGIHLGIVTVPGRAAQGVAGILVDSGIRAILNFAPVPLRVPPDVYVENIEIWSSFERAAWFSRRPSPRNGDVREPEHGRDHPEPSPER